MFGKILIIQTAFFGDLVLTLPLIQVLKKNYPDSKIDILCIPETSGLLKNNPYINEIVIYDKRHAGNKTLIETIKYLKRKKYDLQISPHRSFRTAIISYLSRAKKKISFDNSSLKFLYNDKVAYINNLHEIQRNLKLLEPIGIFEDKIVRPELFPGIEEINTVNNFFLENNINNDDKLISIAPGSVWFTKRFPKEKFVTLCNLISKINYKIILIGSENDMEISRYIFENTENKNMIDATGKFSILGTTEIIRRSQLLISNDSAPLHIANAVQTNVVAIFGATIPEFGFYPYGDRDVVIETKGLVCRPCSIHGGNECPIKTFECMWKISEENVLDSIKQILSQETC